VGEGIGWGDTLELLSGRQTERPTGCGDCHPRELLALVRELEKLPQGAVLTIDRPDLSTVLARRGHEEFAGTDDAFLIGESDRLPSVCGGERWA